jgi:hypothetical protein
VSHLFRALAVVTLLAVALAAAASGLVTEVFTLRFRTVDEVASVLRPLVPAPGAVTGLGDRLVVKTTAENLPAVAEVLGRIDQAPRRLLIRVRQEREENLDALRASAEARLRAGDLRLSTGRPGGDSGARVEVYGTTSRDEGTTEQQVQTIDGRAALIRAGTSVPVGEQYLFVGPAGAGVAGSVRYLDLATGFYALPRVSGDQVTLELSPFSARASGSGGGVIDTQAASSVVSGRLGDWLVVASSVESGDDRGSGILSSTRRRGDTQRLILLRVDELR